MRRPDWRGSRRCRATAVVLLSLAHAHASESRAAITQAPATPTIAYSTYLGGSGNPSSPDKDAGNAIALDAAGNIYVVGASNSLGSWDADVVVRKLDPSGTQLLYETTFGSSDSDDAGYGIAVDGAGNAYVTGRWGDFLLGRGLGAFAVKLDPTGSPVYQQTFGADGDDGLSGDFGVRIVVDAGGNAYVAGTTFVPFWQPFPTTPGALQRTHGGGVADAFVVKLGPSGDVIYATLLGGGTFDRGWGIAVDAAGSAYVVGDSEGDFPTTGGSLQPTFGGGADAFVSRLHPSGSALVYSTYLGGNGAEAGLAIAVDASGSAYLTGSTASLPTTENDFPVVNAFQATYGGAASNAFVAKLGPGGATLLYSSYMGGQGSNLQDVGVAIAVDDAGLAYVVGRSESFPGASGAAFPTVDAFQPEHAGGVADAFVTKLTPDGQVAYSSYLGGSGFDDANGVAVSAAGDVYLTGTTWSQDFPIVNAYQPDPGGGSACGLGLCPDAFVTRVSSGPAEETPALSPDAARILFRSGRPDAFVLRGSLASQPAIDPSARVVIEITTASGVLAAFSLPPGALVQRASGTYVARDAAATTRGGVGLLKLVVDPHGRGRVVVKAFAEPMVAPAEEMAVTLTIGEHAFGARGTWRPTGRGWRLMRPGP